MMPRIEVLRHLPLQTSWRVVTDRVAVLRGRDDAACSCSGKSGGLLLALVSPPIGHFAGWTA